MLVALLLLFVLALRSSVVTFVASLSNTLMIVISMVLVNNSGPQCQDKQEQEC